jgi:hypothetical protein
MPVRCRLWRGNWYFVQRWWNGIIHFDTLPQRIRLSVAGQYLILPFAVNLDITFRIGIFVFVDDKVRRDLRHGILHRVIRRVIRLININISICIILVASGSTRS